MLDNSVLEEGKQASERVAAELTRQVEEFLAPLVGVLDRYLDRRLVRTLVATVVAILSLRERAHGLLLSELGGYLAGAEHAPAGTKRLSNLLRSPKWAAGLIEQFLWQQASARLDELEAAGEPALAIWDESVIEKPESLALEGLCPVRSSKAQRLTRLKPGYYRPPGAPIFVPGMQWVGLWLTGLGGQATVAALRWWSSRGKFASHKRTEEGALWQEVTVRWGPRVWHLFDRGFAGTPWLSLLLAAQAPFILRWPKRYHLVTGQGREVPAWQIARGKRSWGQIEVWDAKRHCPRQVGLLALSVTHPTFPDSPLWLVVARRKKLAPWYLLTNQPVTTLAQAERVVRAYARRWQIEMGWRFCKSELAFQSPRLWSWANRCKLLLIATLAFAFLLSLLPPSAEPLRRWLLRFWCHRTGKRSRATATPLYRLRSALSRLWATFPPHPALLFLNSG